MGLFSSSAFAVCSSESGWQEICSALCYKFWNSLDQGWLFFHVYSPDNVYWNRWEWTLEWVGVNGQMDWQAQQISHLVCSLAGQRYLEAWGTFWTWTGQSITALNTWRKRSGERKQLTFHPPRSRTICVQPDKYWHCFEGNLGETAERRVERVWTFPSVMMPSWAETETETDRIL